jgi:HSP20 family protein
MEGQMSTIKTNNAALKPFGGFVDDLLNNTFRFFDDDAFRSDYAGSFPPVNIKETKEAYLLDMVVPGLEKNDFKINLEGKHLTISAEKKDVKQEQNEKHIRKEYGFRAFRRSFTVDDAVDTAKIDARYENGVLKVTLPKREEKIEQHKEISVS